MTIVVFPVPGGYTPEQAFAELDMMGEFVEYRWWKPKFHEPWLKWAYMIEDDDAG